MPDDALRIAPPFEKAEPDARHDAWFCAKVTEALEDPAPHISDEAF